MLPAIKSASKDIKERRHQEGRYKVLKEIFTTLEMFKVKSSDKFLWICLIAECPTWDILRALNILPVAFILF